MNEDRVLVEPAINIEGTYKPIDFIASSIKLEDGSTVQENLGGVLDVLKNIVGEP